jgi:hypothetical protein
MMYAMLLFSNAHGTSAYSAGLMRTSFAPSGARSAITVLSAQEGSPTPIDSLKTYGIMLRTLLETENSIADEVSKNYGMVDYEFLMQLEERLSDGVDSERGRLQEIKEATTAEMARRMGEAAETLKEIVSSPTAVVMDGKMAALARQGRVDDALLQLLEANLQQAEAAGDAGKGAVAALSKLQKRVQEELDKKLEPHAQLLRQLLRIESKPVRQTLLKEKMAPKAKSNIVMADALQNKAPEKSDMQENMPEVDPRALSSAIGELKIRFGNVDENYDSGFVAKLSIIAEEAEEAALAIAGGREITAKEQQDMMWSQGSVSVWDLEQVEEQARETGGYAVWEPEGQQIIQEDNQDRMRAINTEGQ